MDVLTPAISGGLLAVFTLVLTILGKAQFDALRGEIGAVRGEIGAVRGEVAALRVEMTNMRSEMGAMRSEMAVMRSDLTNVALAVEPKPRPQTG